MDYLAAEATFEQAEQLATQQHDLSTLARLYMPLQEARRQIRQRCGEGAVQPTLLASGPDDSATNPEATIERFPQGQLLIAGWGSIEPALKFRKLARQRQLYVETFLAAVYPTGDHTPRAVVIVPLEDMTLPDVRPVPIDIQIAKLPPHAVVLSESELPTPLLKGTTESYALTMSIWERLHAPFLAAAEMEVQPDRKIDALRRAIRVDNACEIAHQRLSDLFRERARANPK